MLGQPRPTVRAPTMFGWVGVKVAGCFIAALSACTISQLGARSALAQEAPIRFGCDFPSINNGRPFPLEIVFDPAARRAVMVGNNGVVDLIPLMGSAAWSFTEPLPSGAVQVTVVAAEGQALHSRHSLIGGNTFIPAQAVGRCSIQRVAR